MIIKGLLVLALIIVAILVYAAFKPAQMVISREITINASPEKLFPYINGNQTMNEWMPWKDSDPQAKMNYTGPAQGVGSKSDWDSPGKMGTGDAVIVESVPNQYVKTQLHYVKPMTMSQMATVSLSPAGAGKTLVKWSVDGHNSFVFRLMGLFVNCDKMIGGEFEKGLAKLKTLSEAVK